MGVHTLKGILRIGLGVREEGVLHGRSRQHNNDGQSLGNEVNDKAIKLASRGS